MHFFLSLACHSLLNMCEQKQEEQPVAQLDSCRPLLIDRFMSSFWAIVEPDCGTTSHHSIAYLRGATLTQTQTHTDLANIICNTLFLTIIFAKSLWVWVWVGVTPLNTSKMLARTCFHVLRARVHDTSKSALRLRWICVDSSSVSGFSCHQRLQTHAVVFS